MNVATSGSLSRTGVEYDAKSIAALSDEDIRDRFGNSRLISVIRSVKYPFAGKERLEFFDHDTLERIVFLVRRWCRNKTGRPPM